MEQPVRAGQGGARGASPLGRHARVPRRRGAGQAEVLLPLDVSLPLGEAAHGARAQLHHRRRAHPLLPHARPQRAAADGLGRIGLPAENAAMANGVPPAKAVLVTAIRSHGLHVRRVGLDARNKRGHDVRLEACQASSCHPRWRDPTPGRGSRAVTPLGSVTVAVGREIVGADRHLAVAAGDVEHVGGLGEAGEAAAQGCASGAGPRRSRRGSGRCRAPHPGGAGSRVSRAPPRTRA